jgi:hypothetical protein
MNDYGQTPPPVPATVDALTTALLHAQQENERLRTEASEARAVVDDIRSDLHQLSTNMEEFSRQAEAGLIALTGTMTAFSLHALEFAKTLERAQIAGRSEAMDRLARRVYEAAGLVVNKLRTSYGRRFIPLGDPRDDLTVMISSSVRFPEETPNADAGQAGGGDQAGGNGEAPRGISEEGRCG